MPLVYLWGLRTLFRKKNKKLTRKDLLNINTLVNTLNKKFQ